MFDLISAIVRRGREERLGLTAGALTFTTLLSLVPLLAVSFALFMRVAALRPIGQSMRDALLRGLLPPAIVDAVLKNVELWAVKAAGLTLLGSVFLLVSALGLIYSVEAAFNRIWKARKQRDLRSRLALYAILLLTVPVALGACLWAVSSLMNTSGARMAARAPWVQHALVVGPVVLGAGAFTLLIRHLPNAPVRNADAMAGGVLAAAAFELGKRGFALYLASVPTFRTVYGAFAPALAFLVWVYYSWFVTLAAALVSANLGGGARRGRGVSTRVKRGAQERRTRAQEQRPRG